MTCDCVSAEAGADIEALGDFYIECGRELAITRLDAHVSAACVRFAAGDDAGLAAPRPYPEHSRFGLRWLKQGPYWLAFARTDRGPYWHGCFMRRLICHGGYGAGDCSVRRWVVGK